MEYNNKYVKCKNYKTGALLIGIIRKGGYHNDFRVPKDYNVVSAGWFSALDDGEVTTFGQSYGYDLYPAPEDAGLIKEHISKLSY